MSPRSNFRPITWPIRNCATHCNIESPRLATRTQLIAWLAVMDEGEALVGQVARRILRVASPGHWNQRLSSMHIRRYGYHGQLGQKYVHAINVEGACIGIEDSVSNPTGSKGQGAAHLPAKAAHRIPQVTQPGHRSRCSLFVYIDGSWYLVH